MGHSAGAATAVASAVSWKTHLLTHHPTLSAPCNAVVGLGGLGIFLFYSTMASTQLTCLACSSGSNMVDISNLGLLEDL